MPCWGAPADISTERSLLAEGTEAHFSASSVPHSCRCETHSAAATAGWPPARVPAAFACVCVVLDVEISVAAARLCALRPARRTRIRAAWRAVALSTPVLGPSDAGISGCSSTTSPGSGHQPPSSKRLLLLEMSETVVTLHVRTPPIQDAVYRLFWVSTEAATSGWLPCPNPFIHWSLQNVFRLVLISRGRPVSFLQNRNAEQVNRTSEDLRRGSGGPLPGPVRQVIGSGPPVINGPQPFKLLDIFPNEATMNKHGKTMALGRRECSQKRPSYMNTVSAAMENI